MIDLYVICENEYEAGRIDFQKLVHQSFRVEQKFIYRWKFNNSLTKNVWIKFYHKVSTAGLGVNRYKKFAIALALIIFKWNLIFLLLLDQIEPKYCFVGIWTTLDYNHAYFLHDIFLSSTRLFHYNKKIKHRRKYWDKTTYSYFVRYLNETRWASFPDKNVVW